MATIRATITDAAAAMRSHRIRGPSHLRIITIPTPSCYQPARISLLLIVGPDRQRIRVPESLMMHIVFLRDKINMLKYGLPATSECELEFRYLNYDGVDAVLNWVTGKAVTLYVTRGGHVMFTHLNDMWATAAAWKMQNLKREIMETLKGGLKGGSDLSLPELVQMLTGFYKTEGLTTEDQGMVSDTVSLAIHKYSAHSWWVAIRDDNRPAGGVFYQRVAGLLFRNLRTALCDDCTAEDLMDQDACLSCGKPIGVMRRGGP
ncbi:hypothetical protein ABW21_db0203334 [Orbilia brochopaga]|nr:hypothetical protein ABW21_db0203334 [Drechslerella brochopaga]